MRCRGVRSCLLLSILFLFSLPALSFRTVSRRARGRPRSVLSAHADGPDQTRRETVARGVEAVALSSALIIGAAGPTAAAEEGLVWRPKKELSDSINADRQGLISATYPRAFVAYLARYLINFDAACRSLWQRKAMELPMRGDAKAIARAREVQFSEFADSVELDLYAYAGGPYSVEALFTKMRERYAPPSAPYEARRQLALLFSLLPKWQPVAQLRNLLGEMDDASVASVELTFGGAGYDSRAAAPLVLLPNPDAADGRPAALQATLGATGRLRGVAIRDGGSGYSQRSPPRVVLPPPMTLGGRRASGFAVVSDGGAVTSIVIVDGGDGYAAAPRQIVTCGVEAPPPAERGSGVVRRPCVAEALPDLEVVGVELADSGSGYSLSGNADGGGLGWAVVQPPSACAGYRAPSDAVAAEAGAAAAAVRVGFASKRGAAAVAAQAQAALLRDSGVLPTVPLVPSGAFRLLGAGATSSQLAGLLPPDTPVLVGAAPAGAEGDGAAGGATFCVAASLKAMASGSDGGRPSASVFGAVGTSPLEMDQAYTVSAYARLALAGAVCQIISRGALTPLELVKSRLQADDAKANGGGGGAAAAAAAAGEGEGAEKDAVGAALEELLEEVKRVRSLAPAFVGLVPTCLGGVANGVWGLGVNEGVRRGLGQAVADFSGLAAAADLSGAATVGVVLFSAIFSSSLNSFFLAPLEAIRIAVQTQEPKAVPAVALAGGGTKSATSLVPTSILAAADLAAKDARGYLSLWDGFNAMLLRELPFVTTKFLSFELMSTLAYAASPGAKEDVGLSLLVTLGAGIVSGILASIISHPADVLLTRAGSAAKEGDAAAEPQVSIIQEAKNLVEDEGIEALFAGLGVRCVYFAVLISTQLFLYDLFKVAFGVSPNDMKLVLEVLGERLSQ